MRASSGDRRLMRLRQFVAKKTVQRGHDLRTDLGGYGGYQAIRWDSRHRVYLGASESRKDGQAAGW